MTDVNPERVVENLNRGLHTIFEEDESVLLIGEDILDPYGGAFKVARGLSTRYPDRVLTTPISEAGIVGVAGGLALMGQRPIVEIMFGDFVALAYDQIVNFLSKSVTMYGRVCNLNCVIRVPVGGGRGYGPTHSDSPQKHFVGIPNLDLFELSPFHDSGTVLRRLTNCGHPCVLFEDKILYTRNMFRDGVVDDLFSFELLPGERSDARIYSRDFRKVRCSIITGGGAALLCIAAARDVLVDHEIECQVIVASQLYPIHVDELAKVVGESEFIFTVEEGREGGAWGNEVAARLYEKLWGKLKNPIRTICSKSSIIPSAMHLEKGVLVQKETVYRAIVEAVGA